MKHHVKLKLLEQQYPEQRPLIQESRLNVEQGYKPEHHILELTLLLLADTEGGGAARSSPEQRKMSSQGSSNQ
jgi:hypothetical protein